MSILEEKILSQIIKIRKKKNKTQSDLAEYLGISQNAYSRVERGECKLDLSRMELICNFLEVDFFNIISNHKQVESNESQKIHELEKTIKEKEKIISILLSKIND